MAKLNIIYYTTGGNTEQIATLVGEGAKENGVDFELISVDAADESSIDVDFIAFGSPATGAEEVASEMVDYIETVKDKLKGKKVGVFGSNDWGQGEFLETWIQDLKDSEIEVVGEGVVINLSPDEDEKIEAAKEYGKEIVK